ncbi:DNA gyrase inhibitor YacG [Pseudoalteromonas sp. T1lg22]|uniref:DNA gyrase inhibitor YacG n=1 Tax=Pseudoalteromonas sp. T1lg22 TaxID=2077096 RepID=UPI000CF704C7|nr:DNA gyrase inhibitor YacG [Pseudoalteromonas sp. T1lg22]
MPAKVNCPTCEQDVEWGPQSPYRPFCSKRCQLIDLGEWSSESNSISTPLSNEPQSADASAFIEEIEAMLAKSEDSFFKD